MQILINPNRIIEDGNVNYYYLTAFSAELGVEMLDDKEIQVYQRKSILHNAIIVKDKVPEPIENIVDDYKQILIDENNNWKTDFVNAKE